MTLIMAQKKKSRHKKYRCETSITYYSKVMANVKVLYRQTDQANTVCAQTIDFGAQQQHACRCQYLAVGRMIEDKKSKSKTAKLNMYSFTLTAAANKK